MTTVADRTATPFPERVDADPVDAGGGPATATETSLIARFVAVLTPVFALIAGWLASVVAQHIPGLELDSNQIVAFMVAVVTSAIAAAVKWLTGWQQHERLVAGGSEVSRRADRAPGL